MTGRPSGRCAAREALEFYAAFGPDDIPYADTINDPPDVGRVARAALASPCCVSADQEQVKEALAHFSHQARGAVVDAEVKGETWVLCPLCNEGEVHVDALALFSSQNEKEEDG